VRDQEVGTMMWDDDRNGRYVMHDGMGWGGWFVMTLIVVLLVTLVVLAFLALFRGTGPSGDRGEQRRSRSSADQLLDERFARGEIDEEEYRRRRDALRSG
jgi:putative membrane protein